MFEILSVCKLEELLQDTEQFYPLLENEEDAKKLIRILWNRVPELTIQQEKELHKLGRKIRKKSNMKPIMN